MSVSLVLVAALLAGTPVDQGQPGRQGPWPVSVQGAVGSDGGAIPVFVVNEWAGQASIALDGGSTTAKQGVGIDGGLEWNVAARVLNYVAPDGGVTSFQGTSPWVVSGNVSVLNYDGGVGASQVGFWNVTLDGGRTIDALQNTYALPVRPIFNHGQLTAFNEVKTAQNTIAMNLQFPYSVNTLIVTPETYDGGTVTQANNMAVLQTSANPNGYAELQSIAHLRYSPGQGAVVRFTGIFTSCVANSLQEEGLGEDSDGLFFGCNGVTFGVLRRQNGSDTWVAQASWSEDSMLGSGPSGQTLDTTKGNVYQIQFQWLGFGEIRFFVESAATGEPILVHRIQYANANTLPSFFNPSLPLHARVRNLGNNTNLTLKTPSMGAYYEGVPQPTTGVRQSATNSKSAFSALTSIFTMQNKTVFNSQTNRTFMRVDHISVRDGSAPDAILQLTKNATLGGSPNYVDVDTTRSITAVDTAGTTVTGGQIIMQFAVAGSQGSLDVDLSAYNIELQPGDTLTCAAASETTNIILRCSISWVEEF